MKRVEARGVEKRFGRVRAVAGVDLSLEPGSLALLRGPNGAGKSTLLRMLGALTRPTRGEVRVEGEPLFGAAGARLRGRIGYLGPAPALYGELTVRENLEFCGRLRGLANGEAAAQIERHQLGAVAGRRAGELSTGFRRRAGLARALLGDPELVLLDEPWNGLDADASERLAAALADARGRGATALIAAHAADAYAALFDRTLDMAEGALVPEGCP